MAWPAYGTTVPTLSNWQVQYNGVTMGPGTPYTITGMEGFSTNPNISTGDVPRSRATGEFAGYNMVRGRDIEIDINVGYFNSGQTTQQRVQTLTAALNPVLSANALPNAELPLWVQIPGQPIMCAMVRLQRSAFPYTPDYANSGIMKGSMWFHATDPRLYGAPVQYSATVSSGGTVQTSANYAGNIDVMPQVSFVNASGTNSAVTLTATTGMTSGFTGGLTAWIVNAEPSTVASSSTTYLVDTDTHLITKTTSGTSSPYYSALASAPTWPNLFTGVPGIWPGSGVRAQVVPTFTGGGTLTVTLTFAPGFLL